MRSSPSLLVLIIIGCILLGCQRTTLPINPEITEEATAQSSESTGESLAESASRMATAPVQAKKASPTLEVDVELTTTVKPPPSTPAPTSPPPATATPVPTATPIGLCRERIPNDDLLTVVTLSYAISRDYEPDDLVPLADKLPISVTMGYPSEIRKAAFDPLVRMIEAMQADGLRPQILSAFRSFAAQAIAWDKWNDLYPEHAHIISAPPGYSEHQLGTVVDFGSPELEGVVGQEDIEFHTYFYKTSEGAWLAENAHRFGFTLSFPADASEVSGFYYEPWHFRFVGKEMATYLKQQELSLIEYQLESYGQPCIP